MHFLQLVVPLRDHLLVAVQARPDSSRAACASVCACGCSSSVACVVRPAARVSSRPGVKLCLALPHRLPGGPLTLTPLSPLRVRPRVPSPKLPPACADTNSGISRRGKLISRPDNVPGVRPIQPRNPKQSSAIVKKSPRSTSPTSQHHSCIHDVPAVRVCRITRVGHELRPPRNDGHSDVLGGRGGARSDEIFQRRNAAGIRTRRRECLAPTARS